jgi:imidazolonepropionase
MAFTLIHSARQVLTLRGPSGPRRGPDLNQLHVIEDGAVLIRDGLIREVGPTRRLENLAEARSATEISAAGRVVMPGFVDCHTHLLSGPARLGGDPEKQRSDARLALVNIGNVREATSRRLTVEASSVLNKCAAYGTTTLEAKSGYALNLGGEIKILRTMTRLPPEPVEVVPTFFGAHVVPPEFEGRPCEFVQWLIGEALPTVQRRGLAKFVDGCADAGAFTAGQLRPYFERARELGFALKLHYGQFGPNDGGSLAGDFCFTSIDHVDHIAAECLARISPATLLALTPAASFFHHRAKAHARQLIETGVAVALASNYGRSITPTFNMQFVIFLAVHQLGMTPAEAVSAATINSAHALKLGHRIGSLEPGKQADLTVLNVGDYRELAHEFGINLVGLTMKNGVVVSDHTGAKCQKRL